MSNPTGEVSIELGDRRYTLVYDHRVQCDSEIECLKMTGVGLIRAGIEAPMVQQQIYWWQCLLRYLPKLTFRGAQDLMAKAPGATYNDRLAFCAKHIRMAMESAGVKFPDENDQGTEPEEKKEENPGGN